MVPEDEEQSGRGLMRKSKRGHLSPKSSIRRGRSSLKRKECQERKRRTGPVAKHQQPRIELRLQSRSVLSESVLNFGTND